MMLPIKRLSPDSKMPTRAHDDDVGLDIYATKEGLMMPGDVAEFSTGLAAAIPRGHVGLVCPRSGLATKHKVTIVNSPGVIDPGYTGEIKVSLINHGRERYQVHKHDRIAQLLIVPVVMLTPVEVDELQGSHRGSRGFGSSGV